MSEERGVIYLCFYLLSATLTFVWFQHTSAERTCQVPPAEDMCLEMCRDD